MYCLSHSKFLNFMLFSAMRFIHEPLAGIYGATLSHGLALINGLID